MSQRECLGKVDNCCDVLEWHLAFTDLIRIISTVIVTIATEACWDTVPTGTGKILMITCHWLCREESRIRQLKWHSYPDHALWTRLHWKHWSKPSQRTAVRQQEQIKTAKVASHLDMSWHCTICYQGSWKFAKNLKGAICRLSSH